MDKPLYTHDCDCCTFLGGHTQESDIHYDMYLCKGSWGGTVIARYGDEGSKYTSGMEFAYCLKDQAHPLVVAKNMAVSQGHLEETVYYLGYSDKRAEQLNGEYFNSPYYLDKPQLDWDELYRVDCDDHEERVIDQHTEDEAIYNDAWKQQYGSIPEMCDGFMYFVSSQDAEFHCGVDWISAKACDKMYINSIPEVKQFKDAAFRRSISKK